MDQPSDSDDIDGLVEEMSPLRYQTKVESETARNDFVIAPKVHVTRFEDNFKKLKLISPTKDNFFSSKTIGTERQFVNSSPMYLLGFQN